MENTSYTGNGQDILDNPWKGLSIKDKSDIMRIAIDNGITDLHSIRQEYNEFAKGGYLAWKDKAIRYKHIDIDHDNTYDYEGWYNENPQRAWDLLKDSPDAHFDDKYKTVYHPTFSTQSKYSGVVNPKFNPQGLKGGLWRDGHSFTMSPDGYRGPVSMDERQQYLIDAEDYGVQLREADGSLPVYDNIIWGGVLPAVRVYGRNKKALGGNLYKEGGHVYEELPQLLKDAGLDIKVTSGYRKARYAGDKSWHTHHGAVDIIPQGKTTFEDIENAVYSNPGIYNYMLSNGLGILDETGRTKSSRDTMKKTRATGAHFHFGKDSVPAKAFADRMSSLWDNRMEGLKQSVETPLTGIQAVPDFIPSNPQAFFNPYSYQAPTVQKSEQPPASVEEEYSQETLDRQERAEGLKRLGMVMNILNPSGDNSIVNTLAMLSGNQFKGGGNIHIKPENRGKFTALKKRTGHSATWFKEHGTPAQKKMAVFALNARKWKHGLGGNLFSGEEEGSQQMDNGLNLFRNTNKTGDVYYTYQNSPDGEEVRLTPLATIGNDPAYWTWTDDTGKVYTPRITRQTESTVEKDARNALSRAIGNYFGELKYQADNNIPISGKYTMPAIAMSALLPVAGEAVAGSSIAGVPVTTWADAALTSAFGAHGVNHAVNEGINGLGDAAMTALEIAPLGRLAKPVYEGVVQPGMRFLNSPFTGNWTKIGNREYRLSPNSLGINGSPIESRGIVPQITAGNTVSITPESPLIASAMPDYSSGLGLDYNMLGRYINEDGSLRKVHIPKTVTESPSNNIDYSNVFKVDPDKRFMMFEPGSFINYDLGSMSIDDVVKTFGPEAEYYKKLYDVAKAHNFEGKYAQIGKDAEYNILNRFAINKSDPDVAKGIEEARRIYSIPEYRERFNRWGTLGDTFVDDAVDRIDNVKLQGRSKKLDIKGQHGVHGGAYTTPDATTIGITNSDSSDWIYNMIRHETNHVGHGLIRQPSWMSYHNEKIRPILREGKDATSAIGKYLDEMDEIVERSKTAVEYADRVRKEGESLNDALTRLADMADTNIYDSSIPSDIRQMMSRFTKDSTLNFWKNFVGGVAIPAGIGYGLSQGNK